MIQYFYTSLVIFVTELNLEASTFAFDISF